MRGEGKEWRREGEGRFFQDAHSRDSFSFPSLARSLLGAYSFVRTKAVMPYGIYTTAHYAGCMVNWRRERECVCVCT